VAGIVCAGPGCGKPMLGIEFLVRGALEFDEPGVLMAFEERPEDIASNMASLGFNIQDLAKQARAADETAYPESTSRL
jgi:circadian clock protein KaiC